ncbi:SURF1 family protein [Candidatus Gracilibacteria bacterium]|nr:SURF1 family protein [Candidatus Gracilibacteria bacterium]
MHPLLRGSWIPKHIFALTIFVSLLTLGFWQLDRLGQRRAANTADRAVLNQNPITLTGGSIEPGDFVGRKVRLSGTYRNSESVVLRNQKSDDGVDGVHLLTPLQLRGSANAVIVDRGWLPANVRSPDSLAPFVIEREVTLEGIAMSSQRRPDNPLAPKDLALPGEARIDAWLRVDLPLIQPQVDAPLLPIYVVELPDQQATRALPRPHDPRVQNEGPHLNYALQWFAFATMMVVVYSMLIRQELRRYGGTEQTTFWRPVPRATNRAPASAAQ